MIVKGTVEKIEYSDLMGHEKKTVTIVPDHTQIGWVEFRGRKMDLLNGIKINDVVVIDAILVGHTSRQSGIKYNNIVGLSIQKDVNVNPCCESELLDLLVLMKAK